jgi:hypothetical protein
MPKTEIIEEEVDLEKVKQAMNLITDTMVKHEITFTDGHVAMAILLRLSGRLELFQLMAAQIADKFSKKPKPENVQ